MRERGDGDGLDVFRRDVVATSERGLRAAELEQSQRAARRGADLQPCAGPGRGDEIDHVEADRLRDVNLLERPLELDQPWRVDHRLEHDLVAGALEAPLEHAPLVVPLRVADADPKQEAVELRLGERVGALVLDRVLGREDDERRLEQVRDAFDRHLPLLHRLEQRRLCLRRRAVDLVGEEQIGEDRARAELELALPLVEDRRARDVGGHQVGCELDAREAHARRLGERAGDPRLRQSREVLDQDVPVGEQAEQHELEHLPLADHRPLDLVEDLLGGRLDVVDPEHALRRRLRRRRQDARVSRASV